jgi:hypothetical protein
MIKRLIQRIMDEKIKGILRHILTFAGGYLIDEASLMEVVGALITLVGFVWSFISKKDETPKK